MTNPILVEEEAAAVGPELVPLITQAANALGACVEWIVYFGLMQAWRFTFGYMLRRVAGVGFDTKAFGPIHPLGFLRGVDNYIFGFLQKNAFTSERTMTLTFHGMTKSAQAIAHAQVTLARSTYQAVSNLAAISNGTYLKAQYQALRVKVDALGHSVAQLLLETPTKAKAKGKTVVKRVTVVETHVKNTTKIITRAKVAATPLILPKTAAVVGRLQLQQKKQEKRIKHLEGQLTPSGKRAIFIAGGIALGMDFLKCQTWRRLFKKTKCGWGNFLNSLLSFALGALVITHLCSVTKLATTVALEARPIITKLTTGVASLMQCLGSERCPDLPVRGAALPALERSRLSL